MQESKNGPQGPHGEGHGEQAQKPEEETEGKHESAPKSHQDKDTEQGKKLTHLQLEPDGQGGMHIINQETGGTEGAIS
ncbi:MAG: hypothetical protein GF390_04120 [Candidatus Pacebacteria bacterium]|nr:hypothetical protein [Candidatus Paceibacterota bacterium]